MVSPSIFPRPLRYRAVSYHGAHVEPGTLAASARLGFNVAELQVEGDTLSGLRSLRANADQSGLFQEIRDAGMEIAVWTHELSSYDPSLAGPVTLDNERLWKFLHDRYLHVCRELLPEADYIVLTVVETQHNLTDPALLTRLVRAVADAVRACGKQLVFRSFVWHPRELEGVVAAMRDMPDDVWFHTKYVPQDWHFRSVDNVMIGRFPGRVEIVEYGIAGEYIRERHLATCVAEELLSRHTLWAERGVDGVSVRVNRLRGDAGDEDSNSAFESLQESQLWVLGPVAAGAPPDLMGGLRAYAAHRFGEAAAPAVAEALRTTGEVNCEALCVGHETFGDPRSRVPAGSCFRLRESLSNFRKDWMEGARLPEDMDVDAAPFEAYGDEADFVHRNPFHCNWSSWRWDSSRLPAYQNARRGHPEVIAAKEAATARAESMALDSLDRVRKARGCFRNDEGFRFLEWKLEENLWHLRIMSACALAWLNCARCLYTDSAEERRDRLKEAAGHLNKVDALRCETDMSLAVTWAGKDWSLRRGSYLDPETYLREFHRCWGASYPEAWDTFPNPRAKK